MKNTFEVEATNDGGRNIYWEGRLIWAGSTQQAKELQRMLEIIEFHGELNPELVLRLTVETEAKADWNKATQT